MMGPSTHEMDLWQNSWQGISGALTEEIAVRISYEYTDQRMFGQFGITLTLLLFTVE